MTDPVMPAAWLYESEDGSKELTLDCNGEYARRLLENGYTEAPLYRAPKALVAEERLGAEFEKVWDDNADVLFEATPLTIAEPKCRICNDFGYYVVAASTVDTERRVTCQCRAQGYITAPKEAQS